MIIVFDKDDKPIIIVKIDCDKFFNKRRSSFQRSITMKQETANAKN